MTAILRTGFLALLLALTQGVSDASPPPGGVTSEGLEKIMTKLGFSTSKKGEHSEFTFKRNGFQAVVQCRVDSADEKNVRFCSDLGKMSEGVSAEVLEKILRKNDEIGPTHFVAKSGTLQLVYVLSNHDMTPGKLRREIESFVGAIRQNESLWKQALESK